MNEELSGKLEDPISSMPLPDGVITLVFTDIEGSTQLWERYPTAFRDSLNIHNSLLRKVLARWDGHEVKSQGDSFMLAFDRATSAIYCAIDFQRELAMHDWNSGVGQPLVRVGVHTGEPFRGSDAAGQPDYFGPMVNRSARIADAGHGGQILLSAATRDVVLGALTTDVLIADSGFHRLRGIEQPEQIFEVQHPDLFDAVTQAPRRYPPLRTQDALGNNLPVYSTSFVGRDRELPELIALLNQSETRLITIIGFGGMGKTRLALQVAERCAGAFRDGARWIELEEARTGDAMIHRIAYHVGLQIRPKPTLREQLLEYLRPRQLLLALDNVEQIPDAAQVISDLLKSAPGVKCVATSRRALGLQIERVQEVPPLPLSDATSLFVDRACAQMQFQLTNDNTSDVAELCRRMEGIPLAVELAASRATSLSPREILQRLDERFKILQSDAPDLPLRQRALRGAIDWSHSLLSPQEQHVFAQLSIFTGGFSLEDSEAICHLEQSTPPLFEAVARLRSHSLLRSEIVTQTQQTRYFMLEALRDYAAEKLREKGAGGTQIAARHAEYFLQYAQERLALLRGLHATRAVAEMEASFDNLRAATDWSARHKHHLQCARLSLAIGSFLQCRGFGHEALRRLNIGRNCLQSLDDEPAGFAALEYSALEGALAREIAGVHLDHFQWALAREEATQSLHHFEVGSDERGIAQATNLLGLADKAERLYDDARSRFSIALEIFQSIGDGVGKALALNNLGLVEYADEQGDAAQAEHYWRQALETHRILNDKRGIAQTLTNLGALALEQGKADEAWTACLEALGCEREMRHAFGVARTLSNLGEVAEMKQEAKRAQRLYGAAQCLFNQVGSPYEQYAADLLSRLEGKIDVEWSAQELSEKNLDDLVRWALEMVS